MAKKQSHFRWRCKVKETSWPISDAFLDDEDGTFWLPPDVSDEEAVETFLEAWHIAQVANEASHIAQVVRCR